MTFVRLFRVAFFTLALAALAAAAFAAGVPQTLQYQGRLTDATTGAPLNGAHALVFTLWDDAGPSTGNLLSTQTFAAVTLVSGQFTVVFDLTHALDYRAVNTIAAGGKVWVQTSVDGVLLNGTGTSVARQEVTSVLSALRAQEADTAKVAQAIAAGASVPGSALTGNSVGSGKLSDEPGLAYDYVASRLVPMDTFVAVDSVTITTPGPGYVVVEAASTIKLMGNGASLVDSYFAIDTLSTADPANYAAGGLMGLGHVSTPATSANMSPNYFPVFAQRVVATSGRAHKFYLVVGTGNSPSNSDGAGYSTEARTISLIARYYPTAYGPTP